MELHPVSAFYLKRDIIGRARRCVEAVRSAHVACIGMPVMRDICPLCNDHRRYGQSGRIIVLMPCAYPLYDGKNDDAKYDNKHGGTMKLNISNIANIFQPSFNVPIFNQTIYVLPT